MALIKKFTPQNSDQFLGKDQGDHSLAKFGHLNYLLREINSSLLSFTPGSILFSDANGDPAGDPTQLNWDNTNNRLGIGVATPTNTIDALGTYLLTGTNTGQNTKSLTLSGNLLVEDPYLRSSTSNFNRYPQHVFQKVTTNTEIPLGDLLYLNYTHTGTIGSTPYGNNYLFKGDRRAFRARNAMFLTTGTYTITGDNSFPQGSVLIDANVGSGDNAGPLTIAFGSGNNGWNGCFVRMDTWPGSDNGSIVKTFTGWLNLYTGYFDQRGAATSTNQRVNFFYAGNVNTSGSQTLTDVMGFYCRTMKTANITNAWAFYQDGASDKNYFSGNTIIGSSNTDNGSKFQVVGTQTVSGGPTLNDYTKSVVTITNTNANQNTYGLVTLDTTVVNSPADIRLGANPTSLRLYATDLPAAVATGAAIQMFRNTDPSYPGQVFFDSGSNNSSSLIFRTAPASTSLTERLRVKTNGSVRFTPMAQPATAEAGDVYYDSGTNKLRCYNGTIWNDLF